MAEVKRRTNLQIWGDVIFALFVREIRSSFNDKIGISWAVINPIIFIFMLSYLRGRMGGDTTHGVPTFVFMAYGMMLVQLFLQTTNSVARTIQKNKALFAFRQVQPISAVIAASLFECLVKIFVLLGMGFIMYLLSMEIYIHDPVSVVLNIFKVVLIAASLGLMFALSGAFIPEILKLSDLAMRPLFFISGIFFSLQDLPEKYWPYLTWNPLLHAVELSRYAAYPEYGNDGVSYMYLDVMTLVMVFLALACYSVCWKRAISR